MASEDISLPPTYSSSEDPNPGFSDRQSESNSKLITEIKELRAEVARLKNEVKQCRQQNDDVQANLMKADFAQKYEAAKKNGDRSSRPPGGVPTAFWDRVQSLLDAHESNEQSHEARLLSRLENLVAQHPIDSKGNSEIKDSRLPIKFKDAVGRKFTFPYHLCEVWTGMEALIMEAFEHVDKLGPHVKDGHYDLLNAAGEIIVRSIWKEQTEPGMQISMAMWPMSPPIPPVPKAAVGPPTAFPGQPLGGFPRPLATAGCNRPGPVPLPPKYQPTAVQILPRPPIAPPPIPAFRPKKQAQKKKNRGYFHVTRSPSVSSMSTLGSIGPRKKKGWNLWTKFKGLFKRKSKSIRLSDDSDTDSAYSVCSD